MSIIVSYILSLVIAVAIYYNCKNKDKNNDYNSSNNSNNDNSKNSNNKHSGYVLLCMICVLSVISGGFHNIIYLSSSQVCTFNIFYWGLLTKSENEILQVLWIIDTVILRNIPHFIIEIMYIYLCDTNNNYNMSGIVLMSTTFTISALVLTSVRVLKLGICTNRKTNGTGHRLATFSFCVDMTSNKDKHNYSPNGYNNYNQSIILTQNHPELYLYNQGCITKVYTLFSDYPCNCRFFQIEEDESVDNTSDICQIHNTFGENVTNRMINNVFEKWTMMQRLWILVNDKNGCLDKYTLYLQESLFSMTDLRVLYLEQAKFAIPMYNGTDHTTQLSFMKNWDKLVFFELVEPDITDLTESEMDKFLHNIGQYWRDLVYLRLDKMINVDTFPSSWCNLHSSLKYFEVTFHRIDKFEFGIDECGDDSSFNELEYFYSTYVVSFTSVSNDLFQLPNIKIVDMFATFSFKSYDLYDMIKSGYNDETLETVYLQQSEFCREENITRMIESVDYFVDTITSKASERGVSNIEISNQSYNYFVSFMNKYSPCDAPEIANCMSTSESFLCGYDEIGDGICDEECFATCSFDFGDCSQTCNFTSCNISTWGDGICDSACNSSLCNWDGLDCNYGSNSIVNLIDLECNRTLYPCNTSWIDDGACDDYCRQCSTYEIDYDCQSCDEENSYVCQTIYHNFFISFLNFVGIDASEREYLTQHDMCNTTGGQTIVTSVKSSGGSDYGVESCRDFAFNSMIDVNLNGLIGFWELLQIVVELDILGNVFEFRSQEQVYQLNCSLCMYHPIQYKY